MTTTLYTNRLENMIEIHREKAVPIRIEPNYRNGECPNCYGAMDVMVFIIRSGPHQQPRAKPNGWICPMIDRAGTAESWSLIHVRCARVTA